MQLVERAGGKFTLETANIPSPSATSKLIFPNPMDIRMQFHTPIVVSSGEAGKCATFRPTDKEKRIHDDGRDAETSAVVRGSTEGFAHVDVVDECGGAELRQGAVGPRGGAGVVSTAAVGCGAPRPADPAGRGAGCQGGADGLWRWMRLLGSLGWVDRIGGAGFYGSQIFPVGDETTLKLYSNSKREFLTW
ncbi:hypothetical protein ACKVWC_001370 [Pyricularia oryzae]|nr:hypothetical protein MCOR01_005578 [Pyricularia oryzae]KAI6252675.1 hypothetical protein MCOR19_010727 [Pyricularia oryzae]KAI6388230.1 hypothetical protein MCOR23_010771 [Pyricularia oryzae]KAI6473522.1 hypothetical protein MCOR18_008251 [Pyricularia oryzae]KAI6555307.1 hypothetical protein MCOR09_010052 [Pyricularia oryzae]